MRIIMAVDRNGVIRAAWKESDPVPPGIIIGKGWTIKIREEGK